MLLLCKKNKQHSGVTTGKIYVPVAFYLTSNGEIYFLIMASDYTPSICELACFEQIDGIIPDNLMITSNFLYNKDIRMLVGYSALLNDDEHFDKLFDYERETMNIFRREYYYIINKYYYEYTRMKPDIKNGLEFTEPVLVFEEEYIDRDLEYLR